jgi:hypothetical protein
MRLVKSEQEEIEDIRIAYSRIHKNYEKLILGPLQNVVYQGKDLNKKIIARSETTKPAHNN